MKHPNKAVIAIESNTAIVYARAAAMALGYSTCNVKFQKLNVALLPIKS